MFHLGGAEGMDVEADHLAFLAVAVTFQGADLVEGDAQIGAAKGFILVELQAVLVVEMEGPELAEGAGEVDFVGRVESGQDGVGGFDEGADAFGIVGELGDGEGVADGGDIGDVHGFIGFGLDGDADFFVVGEHLIDGVDEEIHAFAGVLGLAEVTAFAGEPEDDEIGAEMPGDIDATEGSIDGVAAAFGLVIGVGAIDGMGVEPQSWGTHLGGDTFTLESFVQFARLLADFGVGLRIDIGHGVVVVEHHGVVADFLELAEFPIEGLGRPGWGPVGVLAFADVPRAEAKFVMMFHKDGVSGG